MSAAPGRPKQARTAAREGEGTPVGASAKVLDLAAGRDHSLVLREDSVLLGWGGDGTGRFPPPAGVCTAPDAAGAAVRIASAMALRHVAASAGSSLALDARGTAYAWGANRAGLGGRLARITQSEPRALAGLPALAQLSASEFFTLALARDGGLYHWGLAPGAADARNTAPARIAQAPATALCCAGGAHALLLDTTRHLWAWGANTAGQLGLGHLHGESAPVRVPGLPQLAAVAAGASHSLAIDALGRVWAWGSNQHGQLGHAQAPYRAQPGRVPLPEAARQVAAGQHVSYALGRSGRLYAWGWNAKGQLGQGGTEALPGIRQVAQLPPLRRLAAGQGHVLASDGLRVWAWGDNRNAQLGDDAPLHASPVLLDDSTA